MGFLAIIAILFIALALCNRYSPEDAKLLRKIIKGFLIFIGIIFLLAILVIVVSAILPFLYLSLF